VVILASDTVINEALHMEIGEDPGGAGAGTVRVLGTGV
jgi:hypothetical protein